MKEAVHVKIETPISLRREILKAAIDSTQLLQFYRNYRKIKLEKKMNMLEMKRITMELEKLETELDNLLPKVEGAEKTMIKKVKKEAKNIELKPKVKVKEAAVPKLERELKEIEDKLKGL